MTDEYMQCCCHCGTASKFFGGRVTHDLTSDDPGSGDRHCHAMRGVDVQRGATNLAGLHVAVFLAIDSPSKISVTPVSLYVSSECLRPVGAPVVTGGLPV